MFGSKFIYVFQLSVSMRKVAGEHPFCVLIYMNSYVFIFISFYVFYCHIKYLILYAWCYHWPTHMELPNTHAHTYGNTPTHAHRKTKNTKKKWRCNDNQQTTVTHFGDNDRLHLESSKQNYYIISLWVIIKAIFTSFTEVNNMDFLTKIFSYRTIGLWKTIRNPIQTFRKFSHYAGRMANRKASGDDKMPADLLKKSPEAICRYGEVIVSSNSLDALKCTISTSGCSAWLSSVDWSTRQH